LVCIDLNALVHHCLDDKTNIMPKTLIKRVIAALKFIYLSLKPTEEFFVACDGIASIAKLNTMRQRRVNRKPMRNMITFGTSFFTELLNQIQLELQELPNKKFDFSCYGEGERKIVDRLQSLDVKEKLIVFYSNDSDLVNLALMNISLEINTIYQINPTSLPLILTSGKTGKVTFNAFRMNGRMNIDGHFGSYTNFVFLCQLMGTDYNQPVSDHDILHLFHKKLSFDFFANGSFNLQDFQKSIREVLSIDDFEHEPDNEETKNATRSYLGSIIDRLMLHDSHELILPSRISLASFTEIDCLPDVSKCSNEMDETLKAYYSNPIYQGIMLYPHQFNDYYDSGLKLSKKLRQKIQKSPLSTKTAKEIISEIIKL